MKRLRLWFEGTQSPELVRSEFSHSCLSHPLRSVRGKTAGSYSSGYGTFQWTPAVKGFCVLALKSAAAVKAQPESNSDIVCLSGASSSLAASLAYALGKPPQWLIDIFGRDLKGRALAKRMFLCSNSELKRAGEVSLTFNSGFFPPQHIVVFFQGKELVQREALTALASSIESFSALGGNKSCRSCNQADIISDAECAKLTDLPAPFDGLPDFAWLKALFTQEAAQMLGAIDIFSQQGLKKVAQNISQDVLFRKMIGSGTQLLAELDFPLSTGERLGGGFHLESAAKRLAVGPALRVALPVGLAGATSIFSYLKRVRGLNLELDYRYQYAIEIMHKIINNEYEVPPDLCVLGLAPAASLLKRGRSTGYRPLLILPGMTHRVLRPNLQCNSALAGEYLFLNDDPSTSGMYFHQLQEQGSIKQHEVTVRHAEPAQIYEALDSANADMRAILFFPFYNINQRFNHCSLADTPLDFGNVKESVLFVHERVYADRQRTKLLNVLLRDAWLTLRERRNELDRNVGEMLLNPEYLSFLSRSAGLKSALLT